MGTLWKPCGIHVGSIWDPYGIPVGIGLEFGANILRDCEGISSCAKCYRIAENELIWEDMQ